MNTMHLFIIKSLLKSLPAHFDIINRTHDRFRNRDFSAVANYHGYTKTVPLKNNLSYIIPHPNVDRSTTEAKSFEKNLKFQEKF